MSFSGFSEEMLDYLKDLKAHNDKAWFDANRRPFDELVIAPSLELVASLSGPLSRMTPALNAVPKVNGSIRRNRRDTRFSKDKTPYHTCPSGFLGRRPSQSLTGRACGARR